MSDFKIDFDFVSDTANNVEKKFNTVWKMMVALYIFSIAAIVGTFGLGLYGVYYVVTSPTVQKWLGY